MRGESPLTEIFRLLTNVASLASLQAFNFGLTLIVLPWLTQALGPAVFGEVVFALLLVNYGSWLTNWGFYLGTTQRISANRHDVAMTTDLFNTSWTGQILLTVLVLIVYILIVFFMPGFRNHMPIYLVGVTMIVGNTLQPLWFLNGYERIKLATLIQIGSKLFALPFVFFLVAVPADAWIYPASLGAGMILMGVITLMIIFGQMNVKLALPSWPRIIDQLRKNFAPFISSISSSLASTAVPAFLGSTGAVTQLGLYNLSDRARSSSIMVLAPISHALFPYMCKLFANDRSRAQETLWIFGVLSFLLALVMSIFLYVYAVEILNFLGSEEFKDSSDILRFLAFSPVFYVMTSFAIHQVLIPNAQYKLHRNITLAQLGLIVLVAWPAVTQYGALGGATAVVVVDIVISGVFWFFILSKGLMRTERTIEASET